MYETRTLVVYNLDLWVGKVDSTEWVQESRCSEAAMSLELPT